MDYEEKYKKALATARKLYNMRGDWTDLEIESIFPELRESEDERIRKFLIQMAQNGHGEDRDWWNKCVAWLEKQGEQKPAEWSEEDERDFDTVYGIIYNSCNAEDASRLIEWLKSLKDRVQPQPKQEWSEEDDSKLKEVLYYIEYVNKTNVTFQQRDLVHLINWLKSLRPQSTWQPSDRADNGFT